MNNILEDAASRLSMDVDALVAGGLARGRRMRRRRQAAAGLGAVAGVAVLAVGGVALGHSFGSHPVAVPADTAPPSATASTAPTQGGPMAPIPPSALQSPTLYTGDTDAPLTKDADQIHAALAGMLPAGTVGPILTQAPYPKVSQGTDRIEHFTYDGALVSFIIYAAKGLETCESMAKNADPSAGYGTCQTVGDSTVLTEHSSSFGQLNSVMVWHHGYEISVLSYNAGPTDKANPAMDGKKMAVVSAKPPLSLDTLTQVATSDAWFN